LAKLIFLEKQEAKKKDPTFLKMTKAEQEEEIKYKSDTYNAMDKMIENI
jgi:hypothetical protein